MFGDCLGVGTNERTNERAPHGAGGGRAGGAALVRSSAMRREAAEASGPKFVGRLLAKTLEFDALVPLIKVWRSNSTS